MYTINAIIRNYSVCIHKCECDEFKTNPIHTHTHPIKTSDIIIVTPRRCVNIHLIIILQAAFIYNDAFNTKQRDLWMHFNSIRLLIHWACQHSYTHRHTHTPTHKSFGCLSACMHFNYKFVRTMKYVHVVWRKVAKCVRIQLGRHIVLYVYVCVYAYN